MPKLSMTVCTALLLAWLCVFLGCNGIGGGAPGRSESATKTSNPASGICSAPPGQVVVRGPFFFIPFPGITGIASPMQVIACATASQGRVIRMEVLVDGNKIAQTHGNLFDEAVNAPLGAHTLTVVARETGGASLSSDPIDIQIEGSTAGEVCPPPSSPGVNVCSPTIVQLSFGPEACHTAGWATFVASGTAQTGTVREMQLWVDGVNLANFPGNYLNTNIQIGDFNHVTIKAVDSKGQVLASPTFLYEAC